MGSTHQMPRHQELVLEVAEKWCAEANTFLFPWGEATITLEDMMISFGFSVIRYPLFDPIMTKESEKILENLMEAWKEACTHHLWVKNFMGNGREFEHEAFLTEWLSKFVFSSNSHYIIPSHIFPIAISLARGTPMALAPAALSSIYRNLCLLKSWLLWLETDHMLVLHAPFQLVQIWIWERFTLIRQNPNSISHGEPRVARWYELKESNIDDVRLALDSAGESLQWRPYAIAQNNRAFPKFYGDEEQWTVILSLDKELVSFIRCLRVSELVGLGCIEQYIPHRVAMQFGTDQDLPGHVALSNDTPEIAWCNYNREIRDTKLYIPSRIFESDVTTRYLNWWKQSTFPNKDAIQMPNPANNKETHRLSRPPGFPTKFQKVGVENPFMESNNADRKPCVDVKPFSRLECRDKSSTPVAYGKVFPMKSQKEIEDKVEQNECWAGGSDRATVDKIKGHEEDSRIEALGLNLEARVSKLERLVVGLKEARFRRK